MRVWWYVVMVKKMMKTLHLKVIQSQDHKIFTTTTTPQHRPTPSTNKTSTTLQTTPKSLSHPSTTGWVTWDEFSIHFLLAKGYSLEKAIQISKGDVYNEAAILPEGTSKSSIHFYGLNSLFFIYLIPFYSPNPSSSIQSSSTHLTHPIYPLAPLKRRSA